MFDWIFLLLSGLGLVALFVRRFRMTQEDLALQRELQEEVSEAASIGLEIFPADSNPDFELPSATMAVPRLDPELVGGVRQTFQKAQAHWDRGELDEAESLLLAVVHSDPSHVESQVLLGNLALKRGDFPQAELFFSRLVNLKQDPVFFSNLGAALYQQQRLVEAAEAYENALALDDRRAERLQSLAQVYFELGQDEKALNYFERASRRKPKDLELKLLLADYYERLGMLEAASEKFADLLEADPYNEALKARLAKLQK